MSSNSSNTKYFYGNNHIFLPATKQVCKFVPVTGKTLIVNQPTINQIEDVSGNTLTANSTGITPSNANYIIEAGSQSTEPIAQYLSPALNLSGAVTVTNLTSQLTMPYFDIYGDEPTLVTANTIAFPSAVFTNPALVNDYFGNISFNITTGTLTFANPGFYTIYCSVNWAPANDTSKCIYMYLNGSSSYSNYLSYIANNSEGTYAKNFQTVSKYYFSTSNNTITIIPVHQYTANPINLNEMTITAYQS